MTRPQMIRADTIDLQDPLSPSAQDHSRASTNGKSARHGHGQHQDEALRNAEQDMLDEIARGPLSPDPKKDVYRVEAEDAYNDQDEPADRANGLDNGRIGDYENHTEEDGGEGDIDDQLDDDDDMLDKISSSPSIDDEDIDFEFVYALHTFFATVEGQANATKGDTMVLLDDSNSYWWLVRVVKDGSIGYLPAEHIETPTERLARLNKHRNIDLSATMLGDNAEKPKNPLKKAMRRRNAKTVTFASPTYFEASDIDYSTEDDIDDQFFEEEEEDEDDDLEQLDTKDTQEEFKGNDIMVEPLRPKPQIDKDPVRSQIEEPIRQSSEQTREAEEPASQQEEFRHGRSRNGVFRNTDSFFKDDTVETKKISLTPNLLRDDANESSQAIDSKEIKSRGSFEVLIGDRNKDDKKRKEKKPGMLSGLFKRKDKKSKAADDDGEEHEKVSEESSRSSTEHKMSIESLKEETRPTKSQAAPQRNASKLQKVPAVTSPQMTDSMSQNKINLSPSVRAVAPESKEAVAPALRVRTSEPKQEPPLATALESMSHSATSSPVISGSPGTSAPSNEVVEKSAGLPPPPPMAPPPVAPPVALVKEDDKPIPTTDSRSESTLRDSPSNAHAADDLPVSMKRRPSPDEASASTRSLSQPSSDILDTQRTKTENSAPTSAAASPATSPTWDDAGLRAYLDDGSDIRDLLIIVHDNSNVLPAGPDHPIIGSLFKDESKALNEMSNRLDEMLTGWLARRSLAAVR